LAWEGDDFAIVVLPDTQSYNAAQFATQTQWIADNAASLNIQMVLHEGDVVNNAYEEQWLAADAAMDILDAANIPYLMTTGNHDDDQGESYPNPRSTLEYNTYFPQSRFTAQSGWVGGFYHEGQSENAYWVKTISNRNYLFLMLEFGPRQGVLDWADTVIATYPDHDVVLTTHCLVYHDNSLVGSGDSYNPHGYAGVSDDTHDGDELWSEFIKTHKNIILSFSGHELGDGTGLVSRQNLDNRRSHMMLANYQAPILQAAESGYLRIVTISPTAGSINITSYSPLLDAYLTSSDQEFSLIYPA